VSTEAHEGANPLPVTMARDAVGVVTSVDDAMEALLGWTPDELIGFPSNQLVHPEDQPSAVAAWLEMVTVPGSTRVWRGRYRTAGGAWKWVETVNENHLDDPGDPVVRTVMRQVASDQVSIEEELRARKELLSRLSDALPVGLFQIDGERQVTFTNDRLHAIVGSPPAATITAQLVAVVPEDAPLLEAALSAVLADQPVDDIEIRLAPQTADPRVCLLSLRALTDSAGGVSGAIGCLSDVTDRVQLRRELEIRASVDALTSCLNRAATLDLLGTTLAEHEPTDPGTAVIFVDLDRFKAVNDLLGHAAGDRVLVAAAERLRFAVRGRDRVGRLGGDEFLAICPGVVSPEQAVEIGRRVAAVLNTRVEVGADVVNLRASIGVAWTAAALDADSLIAQADSAMYESKRIGASAVTLFTPARAAPSPAAISPA